MNNKPKGIPVKSWEIQAILAGKKTRFSRPVKPQPRACNHVFPEADWHNSPSDFIENKTCQGFFYCAICGNGVSPKDDFKGIKSPYKSGDVLYVRETWAIMDNREFGGNIEVEYKADTTAEAPGGWDNIPKDERPKYARWKTPIHMPIEAARIWIEITDVKVQRVQDISEEDAIAEGVWLDEKVFCSPDGPAYTIYGMPHWPTAKKCYLSHSENTKEGWVFAYEFKVLSTTGRPNNQ